MTVSCPDINNIHSNRFAFFSFLLTLSAYIHQVSFPVMWFESIWGYLYVLCGVLLMFKPGSVGRFAAFVIVTIIGLFEHHVDLPNHLVFELLVFVNISAVIGYSFFKGERPLTGGILYARFAPIIRIQLVALYFIAFWAKLNADFFIPEVSCGAQFIRDIHSAFYPKFYPLVNWRFETLGGQIASIWLTAIVEFLIPFLLLWNKTRDFGVLMALGFHFTMAVVPAMAVASFSALGYVMLFLFLSDKTFLLAKRMTDAAIQWGRRQIRQVILLKILVVLLILWTITKNYFFHYPGILYVITVWLIVMLPVALLYTIAIFASWMRRDDTEGRKTSDSFRDYFFPRPAILSLLLIPMFLNGLLPYTGLKTHGSWTMFSNLRILGPRPNHLIMPAWMRILNQEFVEVISSDNKRFEPYIGKNVLLTEVEFRRHIQNIKGDFSVTCVYKGEQVVLKRTGQVQTNHVLMQPLPWFSRKFLRFKAVSTLENSPCAW